MTYQTITIDGIPDQHLVNLDLLLAKLRGQSFQLHIHTENGVGADMLSVTVGPGIPLALHYRNLPGLSVEMDAVQAAAAQVARLGMTSFPLQNAKS